MTDPSRLSARLNSDEVERFAREYASLRHIHEEFTLKLVNLLNSMLSIRGIDVHLIESRTKDVASFKEKIGRSSKSYSNPISQITDLTGVRIIAYYSEDVEAISTLLESEFLVDEPNSTTRRDGLSPERFGYQSVHYVVQLNIVRRELLEWNHLSGLRAEIQIRTVLQHAWAAISHKIQYKRESEIPAVLRRKLIRLSALLEIADDEFLSLRNQTSEVIQAIEENLARGDTDVELSLLSVEEFVRSSPEISSLEEYAIDAGFTIVEDDSGDSFYSAVVSAAQNIGITTLTELRDVLIDSLDWAAIYLQQQKNVDQEPWDVSPSFICLLILIGASPEKFPITYLVEDGWTSSIANDVVQVANRRVHPS